MSFELTKEQRWEIFNSLPESLKSAIFSEDTADAIFNICQLHNIDDISVVANLIGQALMGLLPPDKIAETIRQKLPIIEESLSNTLAVEIQHYILDPVMDDLIALYTPEKIEQLNVKNSIPAENKSEPSVSKDLYREKITE